MGGVTEPAEVILSVAGTGNLLVLFGMFADWLEEYLRDKMH